MKIMAMVRPALAKDAEAMRFIAQQAFDQYVARMGKQPAPMLANFDFHLKYDSCFIAEQNGKAVGYAIMQFANNEPRNNESRNNEPSDTEPLDREPLLDTIAVLPTYQGRGIGKTLMLALETTMKQAGYKSYKLYSNIHMTETIAWYKRFGFEQLYQITEDGFDRVYMRKYLKE